LDAASAATAVASAAAAAAAGASPSAVASTSNSSHSRLGDSFGGSSITTAAAAVNPQATATAAAAAAAASTAATAASSGLPGLLQRGFLSGFSFWDWGSADDSVGLAAGGTAFERAAVERQYEVDEFVAATKRLVVQYQRLHQVQDR
jgi:hypothetical protein